MAEKQIGRITHFYDHISVGVVELTGNLKVGDKIHIQGTHDDFEQEVESMQLEHENIQSAKKGQAIAIKVSQPVHDNDKIFKVEE
ncbi:MAG: hypothetical protein A2172_00045 [Candidatus Woykebacteria bacterium RBG_13_40_15]|uniref:Translation elongation factor-like protein n=1 Tax=Candidatus Woykebacteria bacterium RBG_13_40_15 TaxID=1802593 RepID=A0A1G1W7F2_9BACT|nr:MAG: hypothetical protein A2172_00045 [Candidatus Woykebacteria bacterium RBG_13_40_15]